MRKGMVLKARGNGSIVCWGLELMTSPSSPEAVTSMPSDLVVTSSI
jgi:hypothetical protein